MRRSCRTTCRLLPGRRSIPAALALLMTAHAVQGAEMVVQGEVVRVVPLTAPAAGEDCGVRQPPVNAGLVDLLAWDLSVGCAPGAAPASAGGYRVHYMWDGRTYSRIMKHHPGDTISLRVHID